MLESDEETALAMVCEGGVDEGGGGIQEPKSSGCRRGGAMMPVRSTNLGVEAGSSSLAIGINQPLAENQTLSDNGRLLIIKIASACHSLQDRSSHISALVHSVLQALVYGQDSFLPGSDGTSLESLRNNCLASERLEANAGVIHILALMRYRIQVDRYYLFIFIL